MWTPTFEFVLFLLLFSALPFGDRCLDSFLGYEFCFILDSILGLLWYFWEEGALDHFGVALRALWPLLGPDICFCVGICRTALAAPLGFGGLPPN